MIIIFNELFFALIIISATCLFWVAFTKYPVLPLQCVLALAKKLQIVSSKVLFSRSPMQIILG